MERKYVNYKNYKNQKYKVACIFPEKYEYGICNLGHQIIHKLINDDEDYYADRIYYCDAPNIISFENHWDIGQFDYIFVSLSFESNILNYARMCKNWPFSLYAKERQENDPLIIAGGLYATYNPEPFADFFDAIIIGEGEVCIQEVLNVLRNDRPKNVQLELLSGIRGVYVPRFFEPIMLNTKVKRSNFDSLDIPQQTKPVNIEKYTTFTCISSDRSCYRSHSFSIELRRGCDQNCRFCVMSNSTKPSRMISLDKFSLLVDKALALKTNYIKLFYEGLPSEVIEKYYSVVMNKGAIVRVGSQRVETTSNRTIDYIAAFGQRKITFAPETSSRLRNLLGKSSLSNDGLLEKISYALKAGIVDVGLYFIIGFPNETKKDLLEISSIINKTFKLIQQLSPRGNLVIGINPFYPKPYTPLQWSDFIGQGDAIKRLNFIIENIVDKSAIDINNNYVDETIMSSKGDDNVYNLRKNRIIIETSINTSLCYYQTILSRGDRRIGKVIDIVSSNAGSQAAWKSALHACGLTEEMFYHIPTDVILPWDIIKRNVKREYLANEYKAGLSGMPVEKCHKSCSSCHAHCFKA